MLAKAAPAKLSTLWDPSDASIHVGQGTLLCMPDDFPTVTNSLDMLAPSFSAAK